jgi:hypothetical protein
VQSPFAENNYMTTTRTTEVRSESGTSSLAWLAGAIGVAVGIAAFTMGRRRQSRWERARDRASELIDTARQEAKPWMGVAAGGAAAGTALAVYARNRKQSPWQRASRRAGEAASQIGTYASPWANLAVGAGLALASAASSRKARRRAIRGINETTAETINSLTDKGVQLLRRVRNMSDEARKLYPNIRRVIA